MTKLQASLQQVRLALQRLQEVLAMPKNQIVRDSAILRFEIVLDLSWKLLKNYLEDSHGILYASPKGCVREAFKLGIIEYEDKWLTLVDPRNMTMHTYNEQIAEDIYTNLPSAVELFQALLKKVAK